MDISWFVIIQFFAILSLFVIGVLGIVVMIKAASGASHAASEAKKAASTAAGKTEEVKQKLVETTSHTNQKLDEILLFVNSPYGIALALNAGNARFKAMTTKKREDEMAADEAERLLKEHRESQAKIDAQRK